MKKIMLLFSVFVLLFLIVIYFFPIKIRKSSGGLFCTQVVVQACHVITGECRDFSNSCNVPDFWKIR